MPEPDKRAVCPRASRYSRLGQFSWNRSTSVLPAAEWLGGADRVVCGGGYNAYWEARWLGYAERSTFVPFRRSIDDQASRLAMFRDHFPRENGADELARWILNGG